MHFSDLRIYRISLDLTIQIKDLIYNIPNYKNLFDLIQIQRSSSSIPSNIAEGFAKRIYQKEFVRFLNIALGSSDETQSHITLIYKKGLINIDKSNYFTNEYKNLSIKILNLILSIEKNYKNKL